MNITGKIFTELLKRNCHTKDKIYRICIVYVKKKH